MATGKDQDARGGQGIRGSRLTAFGYTLDATATIGNTEASSIRWYNIIEPQANGIPAAFYP